MGFDLFFQSGRFTGKTVAQKNPFLGVQQVPEQEPLSAAEVKAVRQVLEAASESGEENGCYYVRLDDIASAEVMASDLKHGCHVDVGGISPKMPKFLFDLMQAGAWVMIDPMAEPELALTTPAGKAKMKKPPPKDFPRLVVCESLDELNVLYLKGPKAWEKYRAKRAETPAKGAAKSAKGANASQGPKARKAPKAAQKKVVIKKAVKKKAAKKK